MTLDLPLHYRRFYLFFIRFALLMLVVGGLAGILFQEMTKHLGFDSVEPGVRLEAVYHLALLHGHAFLIGVLMPIAWVGMLHIGMKLGGTEISQRAMRWVVWTYVPGALSVLALITYKGMYYVMRVSAGDRDFDAIHGGLFGGSRLLRGLAYGLSHTIATVGLFIFGWVLWRSLKKVRA